MRLERRHLLAERLQRLIQLGQIAHDQEQLAQGQRTGLDVPHTDEQDRGSTHRRGQRDQHTEATLGQDDPLACPDTLARAVDEALLFAVLLTKRFDDTQRPQHLLHDREGGTLQLADFPPLLLQPCPVEPREHEQHRRNSQRYEGQLPVDAGCHVDHPGHCHAGHE